MKDILNEEDYSLAARKLNCEVAIIKAVAEVESSGKGFFDDDRPKILFEAHIFSKETKHIFDVEYPEISSRKWNKSLYIGGEAEYDRLNKAKALDEIAALRSSSWGKFQIMGFNYSFCGYNDITAFVNAMHISESEHLMAFLGFIDSMKLAVHLRNKRWNKFAEGYNGKNYKQNKYDTKLKKAYEKFCLK